VQEVKTMVNRFLLGFATVVGKPLSLAGGRADAATAALTARLLDGLASNTLHWRAAVLAFAWLNLAMPGEPDPEVAARVLDAQLRGAAAAEMLLVRDTAAGSATQLLGDCVHRRVAPELRGRLCAAARAAAASSAFAAALVPALDSLHYVDKPDDKRKIPAALTASPEAAVAMVLRGALQAAGASRGRLLLCSEPRMAAPAVAGNVAPGGSVLWHSAAFVEVLGRVAPAELLAAVRAPLQKWAALSPEVRSAVACSVGGSHAVESACNRVWRADSRVSLCGLPLDNSGLCRRTCVLCRRRRRSQAWSTRAWRLCTAPSCPAPRSMPRQPPTRAPLALPAPGTAGSRA
jgi:hypothetical protein